MSRSPDALARQLRRAGVAAPRIAAEVARQAEAPLSPAIASLGAPALPMPTPRGAIALGTGDDPRFRRMNKTERRYADRLELERHAGALLWWAFEAWTFRCAADAFLRPDFVLMRADRTLEVHDVKGRKGDTYYATEDALLKLRFVAAHYPVRVAVVWPLAGDRLSGWGEDWFS